MLNALLEIGCEEIPARFMPGVLADLKKKTEEKLQQERLSFSQVQTLGTYRRLTLYVEGLASKQPDLSEEIKGPPADIAFDVSGRHTQAVIGFAKKQGITLADITVRTDGPKNYVFAQIVRKGQSTSKILQKLFPEIISSLYQPLSMRWGLSDFKFIRPIHWLVALCGNKIVKFELAGIKSSNQTQGHRYLKLKAQSSKLKSAELLSYKKILSQAGIVVDHEERKSLIRKQVEAAATKIKLSALIEEDLLEEVTFLLENPVAYLGEIDKRFLSLPQQVLITSMKKNQKYFPVVDSSGCLKEKFIVVTDGCKNAKVVVGNQKVLLARLADAKFFFDEDKKTPLKSRVPDLAGVGFFKDLGTMLDKSQRVAKLSEWIANRLGAGEQEIKTCLKIAELCKADLTTKMVYEFPVLQGVMGCEYALLSKEDPKVAQGILEHYLPRHANDVLPKSKEGTVVALADRIDALVGCFSVGAIPTGSVDPYGLRRAALGVIRLVMENKLDLLLDEALEYSYRLYEPVFAAQAKVKKADFAEVKAKLIAFIAGRLKPILLEQGIRYDLVDAGLADFNDILDAVEKTTVLQKIATEEWFPGVVMSADRVSRLAIKASREEVLEADLVDQEEKDLFNHYMKVNWEVGEAIKEEEWLKAIAEVAKLTAPIELFFDKVMVMHKDERIKANRLALLKSIEKLYLSLADFRKVVLTK
ncbi:glycine--tRNA ligase subunit beta [candidate division WOR-1 bacterium RIFOXYB2_FULL_42_35]|uniref:Glycine--tRNA ligase beta subunit n=1 Tax=candidate division WOR-1 bacterium RIFOXYC2_FULL_41_25 TaxID=1802586 RepID=A0A1F4TR34_UNCSA|nr:MAG: glycine--tRNA ligase subunit beta [candidate division WOR-1 bacterium RIFOXYA2_FULL_41_14]OGC25112.1 MAG: glycine--tRNA ligase subunit beta [candidate division WOR-1 bacterium RIFOXYB2_FULL_42_35]OGC34513.1 MAG: glycine--tRNA ligase subunit beta [candidate division WOR-1 bacterium RIFOXYC2_FULL_41_25]OGC43354.1 MAG: glycine--tRNA ligase subunit beta [candidate division WOR-1 bacterium RIFOXYD2_FULL_41_8]